jgi:hypothetical protein
LSAARGDGADGPRIAGAGHVTLPVIPVGDVGSTGVVKPNYEAGETISLRAPWTATWPRLKSFG